jgi:hypothetical protein
MVGKMNVVMGGGGGVTVNPRVRLEMSRRKKSMTLIITLKKDVSLKIR